MSEALYEGIVYSPTILETGEFRVHRVKVFATSFQGAAVRAMRQIRYELRGRLKASVVGRVPIGGIGLYADDAVRVEVYRPDSELYGVVWMLQHPVYKPDYISPTDAEIKAHKSGKWSPIDPWINVKRAAKKEFFYER
jgi:hypothetical protein